jgi:hypothetical protein
MVDWRKDELTDWLDLGRSGKFLTHISTDVIPKMETGACSKPRVAAVLRDPLKQPLTADAPVNLSSIHPPPSFTMIAIQHTPEMSLLPRSLGSAPILQDPFMQSSWRLNPFAQYSASSEAGKGSTWHGQTRPCPVRELYFTELGLSLHTKKVMCDTICPVVVARPMCGTDTE